MNCSLKITCSLELRLGLTTQPSHSQSPRPGTWTSGEVSWADGAIWSTGLAPASGDDVFIEAGDSDLEIILGLGQVGVILNSLNISMGFLGKLGTRAKALEIGASRVSIGYRKGVNIPAGSPRIHLDLGSVASQVSVFNSATSAAESDAMPIRIKCNHAATDIHLRGGQVGIADLPGESATAGTINVMNDSVVAYVGHITDVLDEITGGVTGEDQVVDRLYVKAGSVVTGAKIGELVTEGGEVRTEGINAVTAMINRGGEITSNSTGLVDDVEVWAGNTDFSQSAEVRSVTTLTFKAKGGSFLYHKDVVAVGSIVNDVNASVNLNLI